MAELGARLEQQRVAADNALALLTASGGVDATAAAQAYFASIAQSFDSYSRAATALLSTPPARPAARPQPHAPRGPPAPPPASPEAAAPRRAAPRGAARQTPSAAWEREVGDLAASYHLLGVPDGPPPRR